MVVGASTTASEYTRPEDVPPLDDEEAIARKALEAARHLLAEAGLKVVCKAEPRQEDLLEYLADRVGGHQECHDLDMWRISLEPPS